MAARRNLPFVVPAELAAHPVFGPVVQQFEEHVAKREAHISYNEKSLLAVRDAVVKEFGETHPMVGKLNNVIAEQSGLWL